MMKCKTIAVCRPAGPPSHASCLVQNQASLCPLFLRLTERFSAVECKTIAGCWPVHIRSYSAPSFSDPYRPSPGAALPVTPPTPAALSKVGVALPSL